MYLNQLCIDIIYDFTCFGFIERRSRITTLKTTQCSAIEPRDFQKHKPIDNWNMNTYHNFKIIVTIVHDADTNEKHFSRL